MHDNRAHDRLHFEKDCILLNGFGVIKCKTINLSENGAELQIDKIFPYKKGDNLRIYDIDLRNYSQAQVRWAKKNFYNKVTSVGLKFIPNLYF